MKGELTLTSSPLTKVLKISANKKRATDLKVWALPFPHIQYLSND